MARVCKTIPSPVGELLLVAEGGDLLAVLWENDARAGSLEPEALRTQEDHPVLVQAEQQLAEYFDGTRREFTLPVAFAGTDFQCSVWRALQQIPYGQTRSYAQIAEQIGSGKAVRAVGAANGRNLLGIVVPCHRVIGADGKLTGFAGGLAAKAALLELEQMRLLRGQ